MRVVGDTLSLCDNPPCKRPYFGPGALPIYRGRPFFRGPGIWWDWQRLCPACGIADYVAVTEMQRVVDHDTAMTAAARFDIDPYMYSTDGVRRVLLPLAGIQRDVYNAAFDEFCETDEYAEIVADVAKRVHTYACSLYTQVLRERIQIPERIWHWKIPEGVPDDYCSNNRRGSARG